MTNAQKLIERKQYNPIRGVSMLVIRSTDALAAIEIARLEAQLELIEDSPVTKLFGNPSRERLNDLLAKHGLND